MKTYKIPAILFAALLLFAALTGCGYAVQELETGDSTKEAISPAAEKAGAAVEELRALLPDIGAMEARFDEMMKRESQDPGLGYFPEGYTFTSGTMMAKFEEAAKALPEYGISDPIKTDAGYHVILRLPVVPEALTMKKDANSGAYMTLRQVAAADMFSKDLLAWMEKADIQWEPGFETLDLNELFGVNPETTAEPSEPAATEASDEPANDTAEEEAYAAIRVAGEAYKPDTTVLTVNDVEISWGIYFSLLTEDLQDYIYYMGTLPQDFNMELTKEQTYSEYLKSIALSKVEYYCAGTALMEENNLKLTAEQEAELADYWSLMVETYSGEEAFLELLKKYCMDKDSFMYFVRSNEEITTVMRNSYGEAGEKLSEGEVAEWAEKNGYIRTKHILYKEAAVGVTEEPVASPAA